MLNIFFFGPILISGPLPGQLTIPYPESLNPDQLSHLHRGRWNSFTMNSEVPQHLHPPWTLIPKFAQLESSLLKYHWRTCSNNNLLESNFSFLRNVNGCSLEHTSFVVQWYIIENWADFHEERQMSLWQYSLLLLGLLEDYSKLNLLFWCLFDTPV